jgi:hypothetical protein
VSDRAREGQASVPRGHVFMPADPNATRLESTRTARFARFPRAPVAVKTKTVVEVHTYPAPFTRKRHQVLSRAVFAPKPRHAALEHAAHQELPELALDEQRQTGSVADIRPRAQKGPQVLGDDLMEHSVLGVSRAIHGRDTRPRSLSRQVLPRMRWVPQDRCYHPNRRGGPMIARAPSARCHRRSPASWRVSWPPSTPASPS